MPYQAGQAFVQVVPSLKGFVRDIRNDIRKQMGTNPPEVPVKPDADWGVLRREAAKEGVDAGGAFAKAFRARADAALRALRDIKIGADTSEADLEIAGLRTRLEALRDVRIGVDMDADEAHREMQAISAQLHRISGEDARIDVQLEASKASAELAQIKRRVEDLDGKDVEVDVHVDRDGRARGNSFFLARSINGLILMGALLAPAFVPGIALIAAGLGGLASAFAGAAIGAGAFIAAVIPGITAVSEVMKAQEAATKEAATSAMQNMREQTQAAFAAANAARTVADARRNADRVAIDSAARVRDARAALDAAEIEGARQVAEANAALADARQRASDLIIAAEERLADTGRALIDAQREQQRAQEDLTRAREDATRALKDLREQSSDLLLDEEAAAIRLIEARAYLAEVEGNEESTLLDLRKARLAVLFAEDRVSDVKRSQQRTTEDLTEAERKGVKGSDTMVSARDRLREATQAEAEALREHRDAQDDYTRAQVEAASIIEDAEQRIRDARRNTAETLASAEKSLADARTQAARSNSDAARAVTDALRAQAQQAELARLEALEGTAAQRNLAFAMGELTPMQRALAAGWTALSDAFTKWSRALEPATLPVLIQGMALLQQGLPLLTPIVANTAAAFGTLLEQASKALEAPFWRDFFDFLARTAGPNTELFGQIFGNLARTVAGLLMAFEPFSRIMLEWLARLTESWADWAAQLGESEGFRDFMAFVAEHGPIVSDFFSALWDAVKNLTAALAPLAAPLLTILTAFLNFVASIPPPVLAGVIAGLLGIAFALNSIAVVGAIIGAIVASKGILLIIGLIIGIGIAMYVAYQRSEEFRRVVDKVFADVKQAALDMWHGGLKDVFEALVELWLEVVAPALVWLWKNVLKPILKLLVWTLLNVVAPAITFLAKYIVAPAIRIITRILQFLGEILNWLWRNVAKPVFKALGDGFSALGRFFKRVWDDWLFPVVDLFIKHAEWIGLGFENLWKDIKRIWGDIARVIKHYWNKEIKPIIMAFGAIWGKHVQPLIDDFVRLFGQAWSGIGDFLRDAINWVIREVINDGLIAAFNAVASFFGSKEMEDVPEIGKKAPPIKKNTYQTTRGGKRAMEGLNFETGGIIPGTRTAHDSVFIHARPRESVMVPEFTDSVGGAAGVHTLNRMAERGALRGMLGTHFQGFADGGVVGYKGHSFTQAMVERIKNAERLAGVAFSIFQGGFRPWTSYSKGTHGKDAIDAGPVTSAVVAALRRSGIVAWDRTDKGNWSPHIHGIPVPGGGVQLSPSARAQYDSFLKGGDGLGGRDTGPAVSGATGGGFLPEWLSTILGGPLKWLRGIFNKVAGGVRNRFGDGLAGMVLGFPGKLVEGVRDYFGKHFGGDPGMSGFRVIGKSAGAAQSYAASRLANFGWSTAQMPALTELWNRESNWRWDATNPDSGAYGIPQSLPGHKMASAGADWRINPATQVDWGLGYIAGRHDSPSGALAFHDRNNWYDNGGLLPVGPLNGTQGPEPVLTDQQWHDIATLAARGADTQEIHVYIGDQEITELVRVEMRERDQTLKRYVTAMGDGLA